MDSVLKIVGIFLVVGLVISFATSLYFHSAEMYERRLMLYLLQKLAFNGDYDGLKITHGQKIIVYGRWSKIMRKIAYVCALLFAIRTAYFSLR
jgi:hypothetical protein